MIRPSRISGTTVVLGVLGFGVLSTVALAILAPSDGLVLWEEQATYQRGQLVYRNGRRWRAVAQSTGIEPGGPRSAAFWRAVP